VLDVTQVRSRLVMSLLMAVLVVGAAGMAGGTAGAQTDAEAELSAARAALERIRVELEAAEREVTSRSEALADAEERLAAIERIVNEVAAQVERQRVAVRDAQQRLAEVEAEQADLEDAFGDRVARRFKMGPDLAFEALLSADAAEEVITRTELLDRVVAGDQVDLERLAAMETVVAAHRAVVMEEQQRLEEQLAEQEAVLAEAEELRRSRALATADARQRAQDLAGERDDLEDEEEQLAALVREQQEQARDRLPSNGGRRRHGELRRPDGLRRPGGRPPNGHRRPRHRRPRAPSAPRVSSGGYAWPMCAPVTSEYGPAGDGSIGASISVRNRDADPLDPGRNGPLRRVAGRLRADHARRPRQRGGLGLRASEPVRCRSGGPGESWAGHRLRRLHRQQHGPTPPPRDPRRRDRGEPPAVPVRIAVLR
jgi:septal ring factor EnvC (AmiA/AmiB activator)